MATKAEKKSPWELLREQEVEGLGARRVEALPEPLQRSRPLVGTIDESLVEMEDWRQRERRRAAAGEVIAGLSAAERGALFRAISPKLAPAMERAWKNFGRRTLVEGRDDEGVRPFRAPWSGALLAGPRGAWVVEVIDQLAKHDADAVWLAGWLSHIAHGPELAWLLAAVIDGGGQEGEACLETLQACAMGKHATGEPSNEVFMALLMSERPEAWGFVEKMLLAAKRDEGVRQSILESAAEAHPEAFKRLLKVILEENLVRFSSVVRAANFWFLLRWDSMSAKHVQDQVAMVLRFLTDGKARETAIAKGSDANAAYLALWAEAFGDLEAAARRVEGLLGHAKAEMRYVGVHLLAGTGMEGFAPLLMRALGDEDLRVAARAAGFFGRVDPGRVDRAACFGALEALYARVAAGKKGSGKLAEIVWPWTKGRFGTREAGVPLVLMADAGTAERLVTYIDRFSAEDRATIARYLAWIRMPWEEDEGGQGGQGGEGGRRPISEGARRALVSLLGDSAQDVRWAAFEGLRGRPVEADEVAQIESLLDRKAADLRTNALARLAEQGDEGAMASAERLIGARSGERRRAGVELLGVLARAGRCVERILRLITELEGGKRDGVKLDAAMREMLSGVRLAAEPGTGGVGGGAATLAGCLGLIDVSEVTPAPGEGGVVDRGYPEVTAAAMRVIYDLDRLIEEHKETPIPVKNRSEDAEPVLLGTASRWELQMDADDESAPEAKRRAIALEELWRAWERDRGDSLRDEDGLELVGAALAMATRIDRGWDKPSLWPSGYKSLLGKKGGGKLEYEDQIDAVLKWLVREAGPKGWATLIMDGMETAIARGCIEQPWGEYNDEERPELRSPTVEYPFVWFGERLDEIAGERLADDEYVRLWRLYRAVDAWGAKVWSPRRVAELARRPKRAKRRWEYESDDDEASIPRPQARTVLAAMRAGAATESDFIYFLLHTHPGETWEERGLGSLTRPKELAKLRPPAGLEGVIGRVVARVVELELKRGDAETETTKPAQRIERSGGMRVALTALARLGPLKLARSASWWDTNKAAVLSQLILKSMPLAGETPKTFTAAAAELGVGEERMIELAVYAPQWAGHVEAALGWDGLVEAVWWMHAHTKDNEWRLDEELRQVRDAAISERTPLTPDELKDGAVDVAWFGRVYGALGKGRWERVYQAAKYACGGIGHKRAQLFADAMLGKATEKELVARIKDKRHQDSIRALGLAPLTSGAKGSKKGETARVLERYRVMQEIRRTSRKHGGSMLQASEKRAVEIGMENLARTAGYPDPVRLQWAMETEEVADLAKGPVAAMAGSGAGAVSVTLSIDKEGSPQIAVSKGGKALASVPAGVKKDAKIAALTERVRLIRQQASRMRQSLEGAMCRGDVFTGGELAELCKHPVLRPMLERLVFVGRDLLGYPDKGGRVLRSHDGSLEPLKGSDELRLAHPLDLLKSKSWPKWQRECFEAERVQPFKQVFRELYVLTERERKDALRSTRYAGHQVQPRQALALLGGRGWVTRPEEGVLRTFHAERVTAWVEFDEPFYTPADVEGLTLEAVRFATAGKGEPVKLADVPPRVFSEVMRDLDLVVSVAHRGGVDPEASESTVEARASLLRETCRLLKLGNVKVEGTRATIRGELADYSLHLGSATVQMMPGGSIWIVPVHAQHRGRLFLPFADNDPKTAEVISKAILLARDGEIKDPAIREQIAARKR